MIRTRKRIRAMSPPAESGDGSLSDVIASAVFDLDATQAASYTSGTTWSNLVTAPADGSAQTAYDFYRGDGSTSATYPTFNGTPGDPAAYWSTDGGDYFRIKSGSNTAFLNSLQKTTGGSDWWAAIAITSGTPASAQSFFSTGNSGATTSCVQARYSGSGGNIDMRQRGQTSASIVASAAGLSASTAYLVIISHSHSSNQTSFWINTTTADVKAQTFATETTNATNPLSIFVRGDLIAGFMGSGTRLYSFAMGNEYLDDTKAAAIIDALEARHNRVYAP